MFYRLLFVIVAFLPAVSLVASGNLSQIVVPLPVERNFTWSYQEADNVVAMEFHKTTPRELEAFERYDERLVKRVIIKDNGSHSSEVKLYLRNRNVRASVNKFLDPFRIVVDLFDADYQEKRDPITGLPLADTPTTDEKLAGYQLLSPTDSHIVGSQEELGATEQAQNQQGMRRLLQQTPNLFVNVEDFNQALAGTAKGVGNKWDSYPPYMYRIDTPDIQLGTTDRNTGNSSLNALSSAEAMAAFAGRQFDLRDENRAYVAYQQVLHKDPTVFERDATHLWKFAEIHLGQENLTLARSYYETLIEKHPGSFLSDYARLRILDIAAYRALQSNQLAHLPQIASRLDTVKLRSSGELAANVAIRKAFWSPENAANFADPTKIPLIGPATRQSLEQQVDQGNSADGAAISSRSAFLTQAILLNHYTQPTTPWQNSYGTFAAGFFNRFKKGIPDEYIPALRNQLYSKLNSSLQSLVSENKLVDAVEAYEALPASIASIKKNDATAFSLAEAYRRMGQMGRAADHYKLASASLEPGPEKFKAEFWTSVTAGEYAAQLTNEKARADVQKKYQTMARDADRAASSTWNKLRPDEQKQIGVAYQEPFEDAIKGAAQLRTPAKIVLSSWNSRLSTNIATSAELQPMDDKTPTLPPGATVLLLTDLAKRFERMGMRQEQEDTRKLIATLKPANFQNDQAAKNAWATELLDQAERYRRANRNLDAGRLYTLIGTEAENFEGRAEALYKGGLLLYNAGRKTEAIEAFKKSADDGNNLYYSNLAKDRLSQLEE